MASWRGMPGGVGYVYAVVVLTTALWGGTAVAGKIAVRSFPPFTVGVLRYGLASLGLWGLFRRGLPSLRALPPDTRRLLLWAGLLGTFVNHACFFWALRFAPAAHGALIPPTAAAVSGSLAAARSGQERLGWAFLLGLGLGALGVLLVARPDRVLAGAGGATLLGDLLFVLGGAGWGLYSHVSRRAMERLSAGVTLTLGMAVGTALLVPPALVERPWGRVAGAPGGAWASVAYLAGGATVLAFLGWNVAIRRLGAGRTVAFANLVPAFGVLLAWLVLGERLATVQLLGGLLAVLGVVLCQRR